MPAPYQMNFANARRQGIANRNAPPPAVPTYGGAKPPAQQAPDPSQQFNQRGYPAPSRANLLPNQQPGFMQRMYGGMRGDSQRAQIDQLLSANPRSTPAGVPTYTPGVKQGGGYTGPPVPERDYGGWRPGWNRPPTAPAGGGNFDQFPGYQQGGGAGKTPGWQPDGSWYQPDDGGMYLQGGARPGGGQGPIDVRDMPGHPMYQPDQPGMARTADVMSPERYGYPEQYGQGGGGYQPTPQEQQSMQVWSAGAMENMLAQGIPPQQAQGMIQQQLQQYQQQKQQEIARRMMGMETREYAQSAAPQGWQQRMHGEMGGATSFSGGGNSYGNGNPYGDGFSYGPPPPSGGGGESWVDRFVDKYGPTVGGGLGSVVGTALGGPWGGVAGGAFGRWAGQKFADWQGGGGGSGSGSGSRGSGSGSGGDSRSIIRGNSLRDRYFHQGPSRRGGTPVAPLEDPNYIGAAPSYRFT